MKEKLTLWLSEMKNLGKSISKQKMEVKKKSVCVCVCVWGIKFRIEFVSFGGKRK